MRLALAGFATLIACNCMPALAQGAADPERLAEARAVLASMHMDQQIDKMSTVMAESMAKQLSQGNAVVNQRAMQISMEEAMRGMKEGAGGSGGFVDVVAEVYATQFTFAELRQIREFYGSPAGQHLLQATPEMMKQVLPKIMESARAAAPRVCARVKERLMAEKIENADTMTCPAVP